MKRFHVHVGVDDLEQSIGFYSKLFGQAPAKQREGYAKWMLEDPRVNFAISTANGTRGVDHFGLQVDSSEELGEIRELAEAASGGQLLDQGETSCCYARSEKHWTVDPQGIAWEHFLTMGDSVEYRDSESACCVPVRAAQQASQSDDCCIPVEGAENGESCCG